jgi:branched-chain amino acid transport system substrate-binding protein
VRELISQDHVVGIIGEVASSKTLEGAPIAQSAKIPQIATVATNPRVIQAGEYIFSVCANDDFQAVMIARFVLEKLQMQRIAFMTDVKQDYSIGLTNIAKDYLAKNGGTIVKEQSYSSGEKDFGAQLKDLKAGVPDVIIITGYYAEAALIAKQARQLGIKAVLVGGDGWDGDSLIAVGGKALEGSYFCNHFSSENPLPAVQMFVQKYKTKYGSAPGAFAALGYDATKLLASAIKKAGAPDPVRIRDAITMTKDFQGVSGKITIDLERKAIKSMVILTIKDGELRYALTIEPSKEP